MGPSHQARDESGDEVTAPSVPTRSGIGPLDVDTLRPLRTLITAKLVAMAVLLVAIVGAATLLAPQIGSAVGLTPVVRATVTAIDPLPAADNASAACLRQQVHVTWAGGHAGTFTACGRADGSGGSAMTIDVPGLSEHAATAVGDTVTVRALAGWQTVVVGARWPNVILALVLAAIAAAALLGAVRYRRELRSVRALSTVRVEAEPLAVQRIGFAMAFDMLTMGKSPGGGRGKRAMVQVRFDDAAFKPLRIQIPGATADSMDWRAAELFPAGRSRRGTAAGPYVLRTARGVQVAAGRALKFRPAASDGG